MSTPVIKKDTDLRFPHFTVVKASAGSGKTRALTGRFVQFLLSDKVRHNRLSNILAITFSNNAAKEMKDRVLGWLKAVHLGDPEYTDEVLRMTSLTRDEAASMAGEMVDAVIEHYSDFQVRTIDSFMASVFKASAIDFGFNPDFEILLDNRALMEYAFNIFLRNVHEGSAEAIQLCDIIDSLYEYQKSGAAYLWEPSSALLEEIRNVHAKLSAAGKPARTPDFSVEIGRLKEKIADITGSIESEIESSGLNRHGGSSYKSVYRLVTDKRFPDLIGKTFANPPVTKPPKGHPGLQAAYDRIIDLWADAARLIAEYSALYARSRCLPYVRAYEAFSLKMEEIKRQLGRVFIEDINRHLAQYIGSSIVPDIYFRIGDTVYHYLIDEFQDTSPIQWENLFPLIENSLSQGGSLFVVGDTKQAIYGFRDADYRIMKGLESLNPFPSAMHDVNELDINWRSKKEVVSFSESVFRERVAAHADYSDAGGRSGLTDYVQRAREGAEGGHSEVILCERDDESRPEKELLQGLIADLRGRGYKPGDIAVLTQKNEDAVRATTWLNEYDLPFVSYSSLDIRRRKITGEMVSLLNFLDSPTDDFSFASFLLGDIFGKVFEKERPDKDASWVRGFCFRHRDSRPLYKAFQRDCPDIWQKCFDGLFKSQAFFPLYDLVTEMFSVFRVFETMKDDEATLVKVLEAVKDFEGAGFNSLRDFLDTADSDEGGDQNWNMDVPKGTDAVRVMTIHKSKGLGFPVAIVLLYEGSNRGLGYVTEEYEDGVSLLRLSKELSLCDPALEGLYREERLKEKVNRLNTLYVGFTRPEKELYVIGVRGRKSGHPFDIIPVDEYSSRSRPQVTGRAPVSYMMQDAVVVHQHGKIRVPEGEKGLMSLKERTRGEFIHRILSGIEYSDKGVKSAIAEIVERVKEETGVDFDPGDIEKIMRLITEGDAAEYFREAPGRRVLREHDFSDEMGRLQRMDRVVIDSGRVTVIDFKTGKAEVEKYRSQLNSYIKIIRDLYPGMSVHGLIAFVDSGETIRVI